MTENERRIMASCWGIVKSNKNVTVENFGNTVEDFRNVEIYSVYCDKKRVFTIAKNFSATSDNWGYKLDVDNDTWKFYGNLHDFPILEDLYQKCMTKYVEQTQQRENRALKFLEKFKAREK